MNINDLFFLLIILTACIAILAVLIVVLFCKMLKYTKTYSGTPIASITDPLPVIPLDSVVDSPTIRQQDAVVSEPANPNTNITETDTIIPEITESAVINSDAPESKTDKTQNFFGFMTSFPTEEVDIIQGAKDAIDALTPFAEVQNIKLHLSTTCEKLMIQAVPESIRILFRNIIDNSIKYMGRAGHMIITISLLGDDIFVILKDTGKGLNEEETTHIFELNFQGSNRVSGNGLGLTQSKMIVEAFGGTIYAKSSPENGMAIYIQLPVSKKEC